MTVMAVMVATVATGCSKKEEEVSVKDETKVVVSAEKEDGEEDESKKDETDETDETDESATNEAEDDTQSATAGSTQGADGDVDVKEESTEEADKKVTSMFDMYEEISAQVGLENWMNLDSDTLENYYMIPAGSYTECAAFQSDNVVVPEMVMLFRAADADSAKLLKSALQTFKESKENELVDYSPEGYEQVKAGEIIENGNNVYLVIAAQKDKIINIINQYN